MSVVKKRCFYVRLSLYFTLVPLILHMAGFFTPYWILLNNCTERGLFYSCHNLKCCLTTFNLNNNNICHVNRNGSAGKLCSSEDTNSTVSTCVDGHNITSSNANVLLCQNISRIQFADMNCSNEELNATCPENRSINCVFSQGCSVDNSLLDTAGFILQTLSLILLSSGFIGYSIRRYQETVYDDEEYVSEVLEETFYFLCSVRSDISESYYNGDYHKAILLIFPGLAYLLSGLLSIIGGIVLRVNNQSDVLGFSFYFCVISGIYVILMVIFNISMAFYCDHYSDVCSGGRLDCKLTYSDSAEKTKSPKTRKKIFSGMPRTNETARCSTAENDTNVIELGTLNVSFKTVDEAS